MVRLIAVVVIVVSGVVADKAIDARAKHLVWKQYYDGVITEEVLFTRLIQIERGN